VTGESTLTALTIGDGAAIAPPSGKKLTMTIDGIETAIKAGAFKGTIVFKVIY
jgi:flagellar basal body rod protein FlgF